MVGLPECTSRVLKCDSFTHVKTIYLSLYLFVCLVWSGLVWSGLVCPNLFWSGLVLSGLSWSGLLCSILFWSVLFCSSLVCSGLFQSGLVCSGLFCYGLVWSIYIYIWTNWRKSQNPSLSTGLSDPLTIRTAFPAISLSHMNVVACVMPPAANRSRNFGPINSRCPPYLAATRTYIVSFIIVFRKEVNF